MRSTVACLLLAFAGLSSAATILYPRGCIYDIDGRCIQECPVGTQSYTIGCAYVTREATCRNSRPKPDTYQTCDYSACHCVHPTVRNEANGQCVHLDHCPQAKIIHRHGGGGIKKIEIRPFDKKFKHPVHPTAPVAPVAPTAPVKPYAPISPVAPTLPVAPAVPSYSGYNANIGYNGYNSNSGYVQH